MKNDPKPVIHGDDHRPPGWNGATDLGGPDPLRWLTPSGGSSTDFGPSSYDVPLFAFGGAAQPYASTGVTWVYDSAASRGGYVTRVSPAQNDRFVVLVPLHPKGAMFGISYTAYLGSDYGKISVDIASLTYQSASRSPAGDITGKIQDIFVSGANDNAGYDSLTFKNLDITDWYNATPIGESPYNGTIVFSPGGDEGDPLTNAFASTDPYGSQPVSDGGPGWYAVRFKVSTHNASAASPFYRFRIPALTILRLPDSQGF